MVGVAQGQHAIPRDQFVAGLVGVRGLGALPRLHVTMQHADETAVVLVAERAAGVVGYAFAGLEPASFKELRSACGYRYRLRVSSSRTSAFSSSSIRGPPADA